jgi:hypothetical protein
MQTGSDVTYAAPEADGAALVTAALAIALLRAAGILGGEGGAKWRGC